MDNHNQPSLPAESQLFYQHLQPESTNPNPYDPSTQASYYASSYQQHYNQIPQQQQLQQPDYSSYYYPDYSNSFQSQPQPQPDPISIHPPGVAAISAEPLQTLVQNHPDLYYAHAFPNPQQQPSQNGYMPPSHSAFATRGGRGGRPFRGGGGRGGRHGSSRGRGRGRGGGRVIVSANQTPLGIPRWMFQPSSSVPGQAASATPRMAWCELCKADCNTPEILEQHKNGKKHKRNLKVYEEMQSLTKVQVGMQNPHTQGPNSKLEVVQPEKKEGGSSVISEAVSVNNNGGVDTAENSADKGKSERIGSARGVLKRKMRGGRGGKLMRGNDGSRKPVEPPKPKQMAILFCELCNVRCESRVVWDSHIVGKKHLSNAKRFPGHQGAMGRGLQALYPRTPNVPSAPLTTQADQQQLPEASSQAALTQLLNQHGIHDAQSLLILLSQTVPNGAAASGNVAEPVTQDQPDSSTQVAHISSGENESKSETLVDESIPKAESSEGVVAPANVAGGMIA